MRFELQRIYNNTEKDRKMNTKESSKNVTIVADSQNNTTINNVLSTFELCNYYLINKRRKHHSKYFISTRNVWSSYRDDNFIILCDNIVKISKNLRDGAKSCVFTDFKCNDTSMYSNGILV